MKLYIESEDLNSEYRRQVAAEQEFKRTVQAAIRKFRDGGHSKLQLEYMLRSEIDWLSTTWET